MDIKDYLIDQMIDSNKSIRKHEDFKKLQERMYGMYLAYRNTFKEIGGGITDIQANTLRVFATYEYGIYSSGNVEADIVYMNDVPLIEDLM